MSVLRCLLVQARLPEFLAQGLDRSQRVGIREHLRGCAACRRVGSEWLQARKALCQASAAVDARECVSEDEWAELHARILAAVASEPRSPDRVVARRLPRMAAPSTAGAVIAAAALLFGALLGARAEGGLLSRGAIVAMPSSGHAGAFLQPLGQERGLRASMPARTAGGLEWRRALASPAQGGRLTLRTLEDEILLPTSGAAASVRPR